VSAVPAVIAGVAVTLWITGTTLNIQSFMGSIMAIGVAVANAILLVTFAEGHRREENAEAGQAAVEGAQGRLRPILMTSCAMIAGMVPMSLGLTEGGEQTAPLARAVIGGLAAATLATLTVLPTVFALVQGKTGRESASLDPDDPASPHYHEEEEEARELARPSANGEPQVLEPQASPGGPGLPSDPGAEPSR
jgi:Cu/Ag efflux pump CusA